jgi:hypothetical protein
MNGAVLPLLLIHVISLLFGMIYSCNFTALVSSLFWSRCCFLFLLHIHFLLLLLRHFPGEIFRRLLGCCKTVIKICCIQTSWNSEISSASVKSCILTIYVYALNEHPIPSCSSNPTNKNLKELGLKIQTTLARWPLRLVTLVHTKLFYHCDPYCRLQNYWPLHLDHTVFYHLEFTSCITTMFTSFKFWYSLKMTMDSSRNI